MTKIQEEQNNDEVFDSSDVLKKCETEKQEYLSGWQRARADFANYKNEEGKRLEDIARFVSMGFVQDILPVFDSFELALSHSASPEMKQGILLIQTQFEDTLKKRGVERIRVEKGDIFNPEIHESIGEVVSDAIEGTVGVVIQQGFRAKERVIRPARVHIAKGT